MPNNSLVIFCFKPLRRDKTRDETKWPDKDILLFKYFKNSAGELIANIHNSYIKQ